MNKLHKTLHLQHHRHTGKRLHHRHTSYRGLAIVLLLAGLGIIGLGIEARATADSLYVAARIPAPIPTDSAVITSPANDTVTHIATIDVSGTCPNVTPHVIVEIVSPSHTASAACDSANTFYLPFSLEPGEQDLVAKSYTITGDLGPDSAPVHVTYIAPVTATSNKPTSSSTSPASTTIDTGSATTQLTIDANQPFILYGPTQDAVWTGTISGGSIPYHVTVDWGDGITSEYTVDDAGEQSFKHHYENYDAYNILVQVTDSGGHTASQQLVAVTAYVPPASSTTRGGGGLWQTILNALQNLGGRGVIGLYGAYLTLIAVFGILWLHSSPFAYAKIALHKPPVRKLPQRPRTHVKTKTTQPRRKR